MSHKLSSFSVSVLSVLYAGCALAAEPTLMPKDTGPASGAAFEPKTLKLGQGFEVMPWIALSEGQNSNVGLSNNAKTSTNFTLLNPNVIIGLPTNGQLYGVKYSGNFARFASSSIDNYNDHNLGFVADNTWSARLSTLVNADYSKGHDGRNVLLFKNTEQWHTTGVKVKGGYGAEGATGRFEVSAGQIAKRYDSNNSGFTQLYNNDRMDLTGTFFYRVAPATQLFVEADNSKFSYVEAASKIHDSTEDRYMIGAKWEATAKTTGSIKLGTMNKKFNSTYAAGSSTVWDADINWSPVEYSQFDAALHQNASEYGGYGSFIISQDTNLMWTHSWSGFVTSALTLGDGVDKFQGYARTDKRQMYSLKASYGFRSWLRANLQYTNTKRNSTDALFTYTQGVTMLTLEGSL